MVVQLAPRSLAAAEVVVLLCEQAWRMSKLRSKTVRKGVSMSEVWRRERGSPMSNCASGAASFLPLNSTAKQVWSGMWVFHRKMWVGFRIPVT